MLMDRCYLEDITGVRTAPAQWVGEAEVRLGGFLLCQHCGSPTIIFSPQGGEVLCAKRRCPAVACPHPALDGCECGACDGCNFHGRDCFNGEQFPHPTDRCQLCSCLVQHTHSLLSSSCTITFKSVVWKPKQTGFTVSWCQTQHTFKRFSLHSHKGLKIWGSWTKVRKKYSQLFKHQMLNFDCKQFQNTQDCFFCAF